VYGILHISGRNEIPVGYVESVIAHFPFSHLVLGPIVYPTIMEILKMYKAKYVLRLTPGNDTLADRDLLCFKNITCLDVTRSHRYYLHLLANAQVFPYLQTLSFVDNIFLTEIDQLTTVIRARLHRLRLLYLNDCFILTPEQLNTVRALLSQAPHDIVLLLHGISGMLSMHIPYSERHESNVHSIFSMRSRASAIFERKTLNGTYIREVDQIVKRLFSLRSGCVLMFLDFLQQSCNLGDFFMN
jgi:hypothetical protein